MSKGGSDIARIQKEIARLSPDKVRHMARWLEEYEARLWDSQIEKDARSGGPLERLAKKAIEDFRAGRTRPLP
ncbi:MAG: hypothetical protein HYT87_17765 [Nitrospirae bacterium]|nr:hypothetical protein [Nitrospirota bacterium]